MQTTGLGDVPSPLCMVKLNKLGKLCVLVVQGLFCLAISTISAALSLHIKQTRKATGREETRTEKFLIMRFTSYNLIIFVAFCLQILDSIININENVTLVAVMIFRLTLAPFAFPVIFILSTRQFISKVKRICS